MPTSRLMRRAVLGITSLGLALSGCSTADPASSGAPTLPVGAEITYEFQDSSVPPQYHRSYVLTVSETTARIVVDSYGDQLADVSTTVPAEVWKELGVTAQALAGLQSLEAGQGCTGGTGFALTVTVAGRSLRDLDGYVCGGANVEAEEVIAQWIAPARALLPSMEALAPTGE